ncbi:hypothetical protein D3C74_354220 [compost metagenome]
MFIFISFLSGILGFCLFFNVLAGIDNRGSGFSVYKPTPLGSTLFYLIILIFGFSLLSIKIYKKTRNRRLIEIALLACLSSFFLTPIYSIYSVDIHNFIRSFKVPSHQSQELVREGVRQIIESNDLPYVIDSKESEERTKEEPQRYVVLLKKEVQGRIEPMEVELVLKSISSLPNVELKLVFHNLNEKENVSIILNKDKEIKSCSPKEYCN